jgi:hypothetical protein
MDKDQLVRLATDALSAAVRRDLERAADALDEIADQGSPFDMYAACCGFAESAKRAMAKLFGTSPDLAAGDMWALVDLDPGTPITDPAEAFARRFIVAYANDDKDTVPALFKAALDAGPEQFSESVCTLLRDAAGLRRLSLEPTV